MKVIRSERANLDSCINDSQRERVVVTREGKPVALIVGVEGLDEEQLELGTGFGSSSGNAAGSKQSAVQN